jgi:hypothetical protein
MKTTIHDCADQVQMTKPEAAARLLELLQMRLISEAIHVAAALGVADLLAEAPKSAEELAIASLRNRGRCGVSPTRDARTRELQGVFTGIG